MAFFEIGTANRAGEFWSRTEIMLVNLDRAFDVKNEVNGIIADSRFNVIAITPIVPDDTGGYMVSLLVQRRVTPEVDEGYE
jgi:hypothetical protein